MVFDPNDKTLPFIRNLSNSLGPFAAENRESTPLSLRRIASVLHRRIWLLSGITLATSAGTSALILNRPPVYTGTFSLLVEPVTTGSRLAESLTSDTTLPTTKSKNTHSQSESSLDYVSQIEVLKSQTLLEPILRKIQTKYPEINYETLMKRLKILRSKESKILDFTYESRDRSEIEHVLAELSEGYLQYSINDRKNNLNRGSKFINSQIEHQRRQVTKLESELEQFRKRSIVVDPKESTKALSEQFRESEKVRAENRARLLAARASQIAMQGQMKVSPEQALESAKLSDSQNHQALLTKVRDIESKIASASARFNAKAPMVQALESEKQELLSLLQAETQRITGSAIAPEQAAKMKLPGNTERDLTKQYLDATNQVQMLTAQDQELTQNSQQVRSEMQRLAKVSRGYGQITRELEIATNSLNRLLTASSSLQLEAERQSPPWELISQLDENTVKPKISLILLLALGAIASLIAGATVTLLVDRSDRTFQTLKDLKETNLPCLGVIPFDPDLEPEFKPASTPSLQHRAFLEAFYLLDTNLRLLRADQPVSAMTISSVSAGDGKSTIAAYLALCAASMGRRVLLIDTDLRRPQIHQRFGIPNAQGLTTAISTNVDIMSVIQTTPQHRGLSLLPTGPVPSAPGRFLGSNKLRHLIEQLKEHFDLIICDAPPLLGLADAKLTAACTNGILLTIEMGKTNSEDFAQMLDELRSTSHASILGIVANGSTKQQGLDASYYPLHDEQFSPAS
jgi:polysaccharide biosynthesis transport protein